MNIKTRLYILTVLNVLVCITVGIASYVGIERLHPLYNNGVQYRAFMEAIDSLESAQETLRADILTAILLEQSGETSPSSIEAVRESIRKNTRELKRRHDYLEVAPLPVEIRWDVADSRRIIEQYMSLVTSIPGTIGKGRAAFISQIKTFMDTFALLESRTTETKHMLHALWQKDRGQTVAFAHSVQNTVATALLLGVACIIVLVLITLRSILRPIGEVIEALGVSASEVDTSAQKMSLYAEDLAQSATQQAAAVQESVASMTEMSSMIAQTGDSAIESLANARRMAERTQDGNRVMERLASSTEAINQANSQLREMVEIIAEISAKTSVINDIVFKTQLLSFNASIEAARAGQHGRGFAVVAEEFGSLAEISGKAAKEIQALLETSKKHVTELVEMTHQRVSDGLHVSKEALAIFNEISRDTNQIAKQIQRISEATREQTIGVQQTSTAMNQMDQVAQRNSLLAGDTLRSASDLSEQSRTLTTIMRGLLSLMSAEEGPSPEMLRVTRNPRGQKTRVFEVEDTNSLDLAFLQDTAAKLGRKHSPSRKGDLSPEDEDFKPYSGSSPR